MNGTAVGSSQPPATDEVLVQPDPKSHLVRFYRRPADLTESAGRFLHEGAIRGERLLIIATAPQLVDLTDQLASEGVDVAALQRKGHAVLLEAEDTLARISVGGSPDRDRFQAVVGAAARRVSQGSGRTRIRAYGEMVDLLWRSDLLEEAISLEEHWHDFIRRNDITLLCGYQMSLVEEDGGIDAYERICDVHTHTVVGNDRARLDEAVESAFIEVAGQHRVSSLRPLIEATVHRNGSIGRAEKILFWLRRNLPEIHGQVLMQARTAFESTA